MARRKTSKTSQEKPNKVKFQGFVRVYLTKQEKAQISEEMLSEDEVLTFFDTMAMAGYKVSVSYSPSGGFFSVTLYGNHQDNPNAGWAMTLRHRDLLKAMSALAFSHDHKSIEGDWTGKEPTGDDNDW